VTGATVRRMVSRACFGAAVIALVAAAVPTGASAQAPPPRPKIFATATNAAGVDYVPDQQGGLTPIKDTFHMQFVTGVSSMSSSNGPAAKATVADPGNGATQGPANVCPVVSGFFPSSALQPIFDACVNAKWPFMAQADGFSPDKSTEGSLGFGDPNGQLDGEGGSAHAHLGTDGTSSTDSTMSGMKIAPLPGASAGGLPLPPDVATAIVNANGGKPLDTALFTVGSIQSTTANLFDGLATVSHAESRLNGVRLIGGLMTIDSITSIADVHFTPDGDAVGTSSTTVQGAKVLGQPVTIDDKGVHPDGNANVDALQSAGLSVRLVGATHGPDSQGFMNAASQGVVIDYTRDVNTGLSLPPPPPNPISQTPPAINGTYFVRYNLASVASKALARNFNLSSGSTSSGSSFTPTLSPVQPTGSPSGFTGGTASAPASALTPAAGGDTSPTKTSFLGLNFDLRWLYLAFTLAALGLCLAPKLALPARLPGLTKV
jgi:hypothetical protein